jgi:hypothetical protein
MPTFGLAGAGSGVRQTCDVAISLNVFRQEPILVPYEARVCPFLQREPGRGPVAAGSTTTSLCSALQHKRDEVFARFGRN